MTHKIEPDPIWPHEGDCGESLCSDCGCCLHCATDCPCSGCGNETCRCALYVPGHLGVAEIECGSPHVIAFGSGLRCSGCGAVT